MRARYQVIFAALLLCLGFFTDSLISAENKKARELGEVELGKYVIKCGDSWYVKGIDSRILVRMTPHIYELKNKGTITYQDLVLSEADKLNGFEYSGILTYSYGGPHRQYLDTEKWTDWTDEPKGIHRIEILISQKKGKWFVEKRKDAYGIDSYQQISCDELPSEKNFRKMLEKALNSIVALKKMKDQANYNISGPADNSKLLLLRARNMAESIDLKDTSHLLPMSIAFEAVDMIRRGYSIGKTELEALEKADKALSEYLQKKQAVFISTPTDIKTVGSLANRFNPLLELENESIYLNSRKIGLDNMLGNLENLKFTTKPKRLYIKANQYLSYGYFLNAYDFIAHTDIKELVFINDKGVNDIINILDPKINPEAFTIEIPENILNQIILSIYLNDKVLINREQIISKDLFGLLKALYKERKDKYICVRADLRLPFKEVLAYFPNIKKAGIETIFIYAELFTDDDIPRMKIAEQITSYEKLIFRDMFVSLNLIGSIGEDIQKGDISITPWKIRVKGPLEKVDGHYTATTSLIDAVQLTKEKEVKADILLPSPSLEIESQQKKVLVKIEMDKIKARNLKNVAGEDLKPMRAIGDIKQPKLIRRIDPIYPDIARKNKVAGIVVLEVTTDINGKVQEARVLRSIPLLDQAAIDTVKKWEYEPYIFEGKPRGLIFTVTVTFTY